MTERVYYTDGSLTMSATVTALELIDGSPVVRLDRTIFCPKGGGQRSDVGTIGAAEVIGVDYGDDDEILHRVVEHGGLAVGDVVDLAVDRERRVTNCRLHTAGHLVAQIAESMLPGSTAAGGHHWPGEARVELDLADVAPAPDFISGLTAAIEAEILAGHPVVCSDDADGPRRVTIGPFPSIQCGGTHLAILSELGAVELRNVKQKRRVLRIGYSC